MKSNYLKRNYSPP